MRHFLILGIAAVLLAATGASAADYGGGSGTAEDPFQIWTAGQMNDIGLHGVDWDKHFALMADIDLGVFDGQGGRQEFNVIGRSYAHFTGTFDGRGHCISNYTRLGVGVSFAVAIFDYFDGGEISDLTLLNPRIESESNGTAVLVGSLQSGAVTNCHIYGGTVSTSGSHSGTLVGGNYGTITGCSSSCVISGVYWAGGLIGNNQGIIESCFTSGDVSGRIVGGLAGVTHSSSMGPGTIRNCYATGNVTVTSQPAGPLDCGGGLVGSNSGATISFCYSTGAVSGAGRLGGLAGETRSSGQYSGCFWDVQTSGLSTSAGGVGKMTSELKSESTFLAAGWDFTGEAINGTDDCWTMCVVEDYPHLSWEAVCPVKYDGGSGTADDPYRIGSGGQMNEIGAYPEDWDKCFVLTANIDLSSFSGTQFNIIGTDYDNSFSGVFDGQNYTISYFTYSSTDSERVGIFGVVDGDGAEIRDVGLYWPRVNVPSGRFMGCLVGHLKKGIVSGCRAVEGMIWGDYAVGGLVGSSDYRLSNCSYSGEVTGYEQNIGGVVGMNNGTIIRCSARGLVGGTTNAGGITGYNQGSVLACYSDAAVTGENIVGGLVGYHYYGRVSDCYCSGQVDATYAAGGLICNSRSRGTEVIDSFWDIGATGQSDSSGGTGKSTPQMHDPSTYQASGWDFAGLPDGPSDIWAMPAGGGYPILGCEVLPEPELPTFTGGDGSAETPYLISTVDDLNSIGYNPRLMDAHFRLTNDINLEGAGFFSIGQKLFAFSGVFDGDGHVVSNLSIDSTSAEYVGLFGMVSGTESRITDLHLIDPVINCDAEGVGCIAGKLRSGTMRNCSVERGVVTGYSYVGGLVGTFSFGHIVNCRTNVEVDGTGSYCGGLAGDNSNGTIESCLAAGEVACDIAAGGLVGLNYAGGGAESAFIDNCYSTCRVSAQMGAGGLVGSHPWAGGRISNCYSTGTVTADSDFGGLVGFNPNVEEVVGSFWDTETSGMAFSLGGTGLTTEEMQMMSIFTDAGWDFVGEDVNGEEDIWTICEGMNYPRFVWQVRPTDYVCPDGVGVEDLVYLAGRWLAEGEFAGDADVDGDGVVGLADFGVMGEAWGGD